MKALACLVFASIAAIASAAYPDRPVKIVVGAGAGSASDVRARWLAAHLSPVLGQPVVVENQPGIVGTRAVARSTPDGYTVLLAHLGNMVVIPEITENVGYDPLGDFLPVSRIATGYSVLTCSPQFPPRSVSEIVKLGKEKPGTINWGNTGVGTPPWLMGELFRRNAGIEFTQIQYKGGGELLTDLMGGRIDCWMEGAAILLPHIQSGRIRALAVTSPTRMAALPDVPTMAEAGLPDYEFKGWMGIVVPAGTPQAVIAKLNTAMRSVLATPESIDYFAAIGSAPVQESPEEFGAFLRAETRKWVPIVRTTGFQR